MVEMILHGEAASVNEPNSTNGRGGFLNLPMTEAGKSDAVSPDSGSQPPATSPLNSRSSRKTNYVRSARRSPVIGTLRYGNTCGHHIRSQSVRTSRRPNRLEIPEFRSRVSSMPLEANRYNPRLIDEEEFYRLRSFSITAKGVVNRGDSFRSRRSKSNTSVASSSSRHSGGASDLRDALCLSAANSCASSHSGGQGQELVKYRVAMLGAAGVGKTALTTQFMTSEYMNTYDASLDDEYGEKAVSVLLDGDESEMVFIDHPSSEMSVENFVSTYEPHGYVVVYSITDRNSYQRAEDILSYLWKGDYMRYKAVILAGNKADLVRSRAVSIVDGKSLATSHDCKFIETSSGINHNVDELLVGILSQIRLKLRRRVAATSGGVSGGEMMEGDIKSELINKRKYKSSRTSVSFRAKGLLNRLCSKETKSKSCENLHVL